MVNFSSSVACVTKWHDNLEKTMDGSKICVEEMTDTIVCFRYTCVAASFANIQKITLQKYIASEFIQNFYLVPEILKP